MALEPGTRLAAYVIVAPLGRGGMGEVYQATDTRLHRTVALKVLPATLTRDPHARRRFEREAQAVAALAHPHICPLFDVGRQGDVDFLVMEYLHGETVAERLAKGPFPIDHVLEVSREIAEALAHAHQHGIIHRDVKPTNIMLTKSGSKLLDFGIAQWMRAEESRGTDRTTHETVGALTRAGMILGTPAYMSPEQRLGHEADARSDIFSLGAVIYQMTTGRAFIGNPDDASAREPMTHVQPRTPLELERLVRTCLAEDPDDRLQSSHDLALQLRWIAETKDREMIRGRESRNRRMILTYLPWAMAAALIALVAFIARGPTSFAPPIRFSIPGAVPDSYVDGIRPALSPDGRYVAFEVEDASNKDLIFVRALDARDARPVQGTEKGLGVFWAPNSHGFGFFAEGHLKTASLQDETVRTLCDAIDPAGGTWNAAGVVLFAGRDGALYTVREEGGRPNQVAKPDGEKGEKKFTWPSFLPDGRHYVYVSESTVSASEPRAWIGELGSSARTPLTDISSRAIYTPPGYLLFARNGVLMAAPFDANRLQLTGAAKALTPVKATDIGFAVFSASQNGLLATQMDSTASPLLVVDRGGGERAVAGPPAEYEQVRVAPDGGSVATEVSMPNGMHELWIRGLARDTMRHLTLRSRSETTPVWSPDGARLAFAAGDTGSRDIYLRWLDGSRSDEPLLVVPGDQSPVNWSRDGRVLVFDNSTDGVQKGVWVLPLEGDRKPVPFVDTPFEECCGHFSPDGRWIAYVSDESGKSQIYVKPFPGPGRAVQVSTSTGRKPRWHSDRNELFFLDGRKAMAAMMPADGSSFEAQPVRMLFEAEAPILAWDVVPHSDRFLVATSKREQGFPAIEILVNWTGTLNQR
jgi:eukaryotic-like serine/threonine-protein kinase